MSHARAAMLAKPTLLAAEPQLFVADIAVACEFYKATLGFQVAFIYGDPPFYAQVSRDGARLNLRFLDGPGIRRDREAGEDLLSATITVDDAKLLFLEFQQARAPLHQALQTEPWGASTFIVRDPDNNLILFAGQAE